MKLVKPAARLTFFVAGWTGRGASGCGLLEISSQLSPSSLDQHQTGPVSPAQSGYGEVSSIVFSIGIFPSHVFLYFVYSATIRFMFVVLLSLSTKIVSIQYDSEIRVYRLYILQ